ncbi:ABC transporter permease subunit [Halorussus pelagicus]|uniref:ABC transporter permease subunit n=1 Tax=Halorussus pelagicus TaxID=2505977 RepID=UPI000FFC4371|nr:ABC transporter permease subunit [Halorussus pelagicus]
MTTVRTFCHDLYIVRRTLLGKILVGLSIGTTLGSILVGFALSNGSLTTDFLVFSMWLVVGTVLPLGALLTSAVTIAADRESGRLRLLFGTPITKTDVFVGTLLSRLVVVTIAVVAGFALAGVTLGFLSIDLTRSSFWKTAGFTLLLCIVYNSFGTTISAICSTRLRAITAALVFYVVSSIWPQIVKIVAGSDETRLGKPTTAETLTHFLGTLSPFGAYSQAVTPSQAIYAETVTGSLLATPTMLLILLTWAVLPIPLGYWWFARTDV